MQIVQKYKFYILSILILFGIGYLFLVYGVSQVKNLKDVTISNGLEITKFSPTFDSKDGVTHSYVDFISNDSQNTLMLESYSGYSLKFEKADMDAARSDNAWRYLEVFKNNISVLKIDSEEIEPWGYKFVGYDRYDFDGNSYFVIEDWCGGAICGGQLIPLIVGKDGLKQGSAVDWPINRSRGYSFKNGELYIYFYDKSKEIQSEGPVFFRFNKTSGDLIGQEVSEVL